MFVGTLIVAVLPVPADTIVIGVPLFILYVNVYGAVPPLPVIVMVGWEPFTQTLVPPEIVAPMANGFGLPLKAGVGVDKFGFADTDKEERSTKSTTAM